MRNRPLAEIIQQNKDKFSILTTRHSIFHLSALEATLKTIQPNS